MQHLNVFGWYPQKTGKLSQYNPHIFQFSDTENGLKQQHDAISWFHIGQKLNVMFYVVFQTLNIITNWTTLYFFVSLILNTE